MQKPHNTHYNYVSCTYSMYVRACRFHVDVEMAQTVFLVKMIMYVYLLYLVSWASHGSFCLLVPYHWYGSMAVDVMMCHCLPTYV